MEYKMCKAFQEITQEAREEGYKSGMDVGYKSGMNEGYNSGMEAGMEAGIETGMKTILYANVNALMETLNFTLEQALDALKIDKNQREKFYS